MAAMTDNIDDLPDVVSFLPQKVAEEIGKSTVAFSLMEDALNGLIADLLGAGMTAGQAVTFKIRNITDRFELAKILVDLKVKFDDHKTEALDAIKKASEANGRRNILIHHAITSITFNVKPGSHLIKYRKKDHRIRKKPVETALKTTELEAITRDLRLLARALGGAATRYRVSCGTPARRP
jgi:hypothetical protein